MRLIRCCSAFVLVCAVTACGSSATSTPTGTTETSKPSSTPDPSGASDTGGCTVTFGDGAASANVTSCSAVQSTVGDATVFELSGEATGLDSPTYTVKVTFPSAPEVKTYTTDDLVFVENKLSLASVGTPDPNDVVRAMSYDVLFDPSDTTKPRYGSVTTTFTSASHGTMDLVYQTNRDCYPTSYATARITF